MKWIERLMFWRRGETDGQRRATEALKEVEAQGSEVRKLTHSLRRHREINHLGARIRLAMEVKRDNQ